MKTPSLCVQCLHLKFFYEVDPEASCFRVPVFRRKRSSKVFGRGLGGGSSRGSRAETGSGVGSSARIGSSRGFRRGF